MRALSKRSLTLEEGYYYEYGLALVKTAASLVYTQTLALTNQLEPVTDSPLISRSMRNRVSEKVGRKPISCLSGQAIKKIQPSLLVFVSMAGTKTPFATPVPTETTSTDTSAGVDARVIVFNCECHTYEQVIALFANTFLA